MRVETTRRDGSDESLRGLEESPSAFSCSLTHFVDIRAHLGSEIAQLEKTVQKLRRELAASQRIANEKEDKLNETIKSLRADLRTQQTSISAFIWHHSLRSFVSSTSIEIANVEKAVQELSNQLVTFHCAANQEKEILNETITSLRAEQHHSGELIATLGCASLRSTSVSQKNHTSRTQCPGNQRPTQRLPPQG